MFRKILYSFVIFFVYITSCCGAQSQPPANYRQFIHTVTVEKHSDYVLCTLTLQSGLKFYDWFWTDKDDILYGKDVEEVVESYREGDELFFANRQFPQHCRILSGEVTHTWFPAENFVDSLPRIEKIEMVKPSTSLPAWYSFPGAIITLSDGSSWKVVAGSTLWSRAQVGNHILVSHLPSSSNYLLINIDCGSCNADEVARLR